MLKGQYIAALDSYIKDVGEPIYAFAFISNLLKQLADVNASTFANFRSAVLTHIPDLIQLSRYCEVLQQFLSLSCEPLLEKLSIKLIGN
jgi:hypothetical protein